MGARLDTERNVWVATVRPDGSPHLTPVWFVFVDETFWVGTGAENVKTANVRIEPRVSLCLADGDDPVVAEGHVEICERPFPHAVASAFMAKYGWDVTRLEDADVGAIALWQIIVTRWLLGGSTA